MPLQDTNLTRQPEVEPLKTWPGGSTSNTGNSVSNANPIAPEEHLIKDEKLHQAAMSALEGREWHQKRVEEERVQNLEKHKTDILAEKKQCEDAIVALEREKEVFELQWVNLNEIKVPLDQEMTGLIEQEVKTEAEEKKKEQEEIAADSAALRTPLEALRWEIQKRRHELEEKKWMVQANITEINTKMNALGDQYRIILNKEDQKKRRMKEIEDEIKNL